MSGAAWVAPPRRVPWGLAPFVWIAAKIAGKDPLPARLLSHFPKGAIGAGIFEALTAHAPRDLDARTLAIARIASAATAGCPFCIDMNAATFTRAGLTREELDALLAGNVEALAKLPERERLAAAYARALSATPVVIEDALREGLAAAFTPRELVVLATTIAQVNYWARFNQGLGVPSAGFFDESVCRR